MEVLQHNYLIFDISTQPFSLIYWVLTLSIFYFLIFQNWCFFFMTAVFLLIALGMETFSGLRYFAEHSRIYYELFIILGIASIAPLKKNKGIQEKMNVFNLKQITVVPIIFIICLYTFIGSANRASTEQNWCDWQFGCGLAKGYMTDLIGHFCNDKFLNLVNLN